MLNILKTFIVARMQLDELIELAAYGRALKAEYEEQAVAEPDWLPIQLNALKREIQARVADSLEKRRRHVKAQLESMKSPTQRKQELTKELRELEEALEV